jgi:hypothetical protein
MSYLVKYFDPIAAIQNNEILDRICDDKYPNYSKDSERDLFYGWLPAVSNDCLSRQPNQKTVSGISLRMIKLYTTFFRCDFTVWKVQNLGSLLLAHPAFILIIKTALYDVK